MLIYKKQLKKVKKKREKVKEKRERLWINRTRIIYSEVNKGKSFPFSLDIVIVTNVCINSFQPFPANQSFDSSLNPYGQQQQQQQPQQQWPQQTGMTNMSFAEPIQQQQQQNFNNPYGQQQGFNTFSLQAQMTGMPLQSQMTGIPQQQQQQQQFQTQQPQFTGASSNPFGGQFPTTTGNNAQSGIFGVSSQVRIFSAFCITLSIWLVHLQFTIIVYWYAAVTCIGNGNINKSNYFESPPLQVE